MNKLFFVLIFALFFPNFSFSQVGINTTTPASQLDVKAGNPAAPTNIDGVLIPRINSFPSINPTAIQDAMMVYLTTEVSGNQPGFYYWENATSSWVAIGGRIGWSLNGNTNTGTTEFLGTINDKDLVFKRFGIQAGLIGITNTSFGEQSLKPFNTGLYNAGFGSYSLNANTSGGYNTALGRSALRKNTIGSFNVAIGTASMFENIIGNENISIGNYCLYNAKGNSNVAIGFDALFNLGATGNTNIALGYNAGNGLLTGNRNIMIGQYSNVPNTNGSDQMSIANVIYGANMDATTTGKIGIGEPNPKTKLEINGGLTLKNNGIFGSSNIIVGDNSYLKTSYNGATPLTISAGLSIGQIIIIQCESGNATIFDGLNINIPASQLTLNGQDVISFVWNGSKWIMISFSDNN